MWAEGLADRLVVTGAAEGAGGGAQVWRRMSEPKHLCHGHTVPERALPTPLLGMGLRKLTVLSVSVRSSHGGPYGTRHHPLL